ncbi:hypothetical protein BCF33_2324 [Hasllibacter halocynthiae]|uniref:Lipoprotein n=1 Tax=Hasllibacter halocynthiae TaxID=595589 RepID=A0A2T0X3C9_9RHOB|nr:hypothetical protein [Hasllibacter halocynthiae]PRY93456.1 hypothetical protein BCF33_2324 [Hasllibacter halocynthiae]
MRAAILAPALLSLAACAGGGGGPAPNEMNVTQSGGGTFSGVAGSGWTDEELRENAFGVLCPAGRPVTELSVERAPDGSARFGGRCG